MEIITTKMRLVKRLAVAALALCLYATVAYAAPKDVHGWQKVKWGTTSAQLEATYGDQLKQEPAKQGGTVYTIDPYEIFGRDFVVKFFWKDGSTVNRVLVAFFSEEGAGQDRNIFDRILQSMSAKYGAPTKIKDEDTVTTKGGKVDVGYMWAFPSTVIRLNFWYHSFAGMRDNLARLIEFNRELAEKAGTPYNEPSLEEAYDINNISIDYSAVETDKF